MGRGSRLGTEHCQRIALGSICMELAKRGVVRDKFLEGHGLKAVYVNARVEHSGTAHDERPVVVARVVVDEFHEKLTTKMIRELYLETADNYINHEMEKGA